MSIPSDTGIRGDPWHFCDRCGYPYRMSELQWQDGLLLCPTDWDSQTTTQRDLQIVQCIDEATLYPDAQLSPKLTNPVPANEEE